MPRICGRKAIASASFIFHSNTLQVCLRVRHGLQHVATLRLELWSVSACMFRTERRHMDGVRFNCRDSAWLLLQDDAQLGVKRCTVMMQPRGCERTQRLL